MIAHADIRVDDAHFRDYLRRVGLSVPTSSIEKGKAA